MIPEDFEALEEENKRLNDALQAVMQERDEVRAKYMSALKRHLQDAREWNELVKSARVTMKAQAKTIADLQNTQSVLEMLSDWAPVGEKQ